MLQAANDRAEARAASPEMARIFAAPLDPSWQGEGRDSTAPECQASHGRHRTAFALRSPSVVGLSKEEKPLSTAANERTAKLQGRRSSILARSETFPFSTVCEPEGAETTASLASGGTKPTEEVAAAGVGRAEGEWRLCRGLSKLALGEDSEVLILRSDDYAIRSACACLRLRRSVV